jgi:UDP-N-acetylglucosamine 2-epimerase (non-hydrolysing)
MKKPLIDIIAGARPNFMKIAPIIRALQAFEHKMCYRLIHTGQHYDAAMSATFFKQLCIPEPTYNLEVGSGTQAEMTGAIMVKYEKILKASPSNICLVVGDVTSTMACAVVARKCGISVAHVEAGLRSGDWSMPEEINRIVTDSVSNWFFTTSEYANSNLRREGVDDKRIFYVGNTMIDTLLTNLPHLRRPQIWQDVNLKSKGYILLTLHRPSNVDDPETLSKVLHNICEATKGFPIIFPIHPRTAAQLEKIEFPREQYHFITPQGYLEFMYLVKNSLAVITDSGGVTEETTYLNIPCFTLRQTTERPETITQGTNQLILPDSTELATSMNSLFKGSPKQGIIPAFWDGQTGQRIASILSDLVDISPIILPKI